MRSTRCPTLDELAAFSSGRLPTDSFQALAEHLEGCPDCQANLSTVASDDPWLNAFRTPQATDSFLEEPECREAVVRYQSAVRQASTAGRSPDLGRLGNYELLEELGRGGMGVVYKARHVLLGQLVALKVLPAERLSDAQAVERFLREMKAQGGLQHPNLVTARDADATAGQYYLVLELVEGQDLTTIVRRQGPLSIADACEVVWQVALGLQYLHEQGLVHRDIKPSNLMRTPEGQVKVLDMGLARFVYGDQPASAELTERGQLLGTADYMAPEQWDDPRQADIRADVYSLGCTLFYLLTGQALFAPYRSRSEKLKAHITEPPPDVRQQRPEVPAALAELLGRMLAKKPEDRPQTPSEVVAMLAAVAPNSPSVRRPRWPSPPRAWLMAGALGLVALIAFSVPLLRHDWREQKSERPQMLEPVREARTPEVLRIEVQHFDNVKGEYSVNRGLLGKTSFEARFDDSVKVQAVLSQPAYAYLISFRPDGVEELCFPESEDEPPPLTDRPRYPSVSRGVNYGLTEGEGLQVFAVVASNHRLPAYKEWRQQCGESPWKKSALAPAFVASTVGLLVSCEGQGPLLAVLGILPGRSMAVSGPGVVWWDDGEDVFELTQENPTGQRAKGQTIGGKSLMVELTNWLRRSPQVETAAAVGFAVLPKKSP
jgi:serine/threonine protein kinase